MKQVLAFSSSRTGGGRYLDAVVPPLAAFLGPRQRTLAFVPFASVDSYGRYFEAVQEGLASLPHKIRLVTEENAAEAITTADAIVVGGGNTFKLLHQLYTLELVNLIRERVSAGIPYIGWSAGSNLTGPTICTTNDMPIVQPKSFAAFGFFPFQLNPHYRNEVAKDFHGETRDQRLEEFLKLNPDKQIMALPEGTWLVQQGSRLIFDGGAQGVRMTRDGAQTIHEIINPGTELTT